MLPPFMLGGLDGECNSAVVCPVRAEVRTYLKVYGNSDGSQLVSNALRSPR
jgi:hypothetical protein